MQEKIQKAGNKKLEYRLIEESGPEHDKVFRVEALLDGQKIGEGSGRNKKLAEQQAAYQALLSEKRDK